MTSLSGVRDGKDFHFNQCWRNCHEFLTQRAKFEKCWWGGGLQKVVNLCEFELNTSNYWRDYIFYNLRRKDNEE